MMAVAVAAAAFSVCEAAAFVASDNSVVAASDLVAVAGQTRGSLYVEKETQKVGTSVAVPSTEEGKSLVAKAIPGCWRRYQLTDQKGPLDHLSSFVLAFLDVFFAPTSSPLS